MEPAHGRYNQALTRQPVERHLQRWWGQTQGSSGFAGREGVAARSRQILEVLPRLGVARARFYSLQVTVFVTLCKQNRKYVVAEFWKLLIRRGDQAVAIRLSGAANGDRKVPWVFPCRGATPVTLEIDDRQYLAVGAGGRIGQTAAYARLTDITLPQESGVVWVFALLEWDWAGGAS